MLLAMACLLEVHAQQRITVIVKSQATQQTIAGANIQQQKKASITDSLGRAVFTDLPPGMNVFRSSHVGFAEQSDTLLLSSNSSDTLVVYLIEEAEDIEEVIVQSTRTSRTIKNTPTRIETIDGEELDEKNNMRPANVSMLLHESTGLQVQQTSATSGNASIRVQGLDGRYTQLLKDGYPNFGNFASGLSILEIPPLDLQQVEIIKGPASTLYGGGAIAGVVNFISKQPKLKWEGDFLLNQSNVGQSNVGAYLSKRNQYFGFSLLALANWQKAYDVDGDDFSELPESNSFTLHPRLFWYPNASTTLMLGNSFTQGSNTGGDMQVIIGKAANDHRYFEKNETLRNTTTLEFTKKWSNWQVLKFKQSISWFNRTIAIPDYRFEGKNTNAFSDLSFVFYRSKHTWITGLNAVVDDFNHRSGNTLNAHSNTFGGYVQDTWDLLPKLQLESGIRFDRVQYESGSTGKNDWFVLPRVNALFKISSKLTSRIGGGLGYKLPTIFTEQTESRQYQNLLPLNNASAETSMGATADLNYSTTLFPGMAFSANQLFFLTSISNPLVLQSNASGAFFFSNAIKPITTKGFETNLKFIYQKSLKLFVGYTFTDAKALYLPVNQFLPLLPKHKLNLTLMYEKDDNFKLGLEGYYTGSQFLYNGTQTPAYWEFGFMAQKTFHHISFFVNFENFTDQRQSKYKTVSNAPHQNPGFDDIWNHTEGFVFNGGIKFKL